jgi:predicted signal transduction protein with EAL and GGDEF domain
MALELAQAYQTALDTVPVPVLVLSQRELTVECANHAFLNLVGLSLEEVRHRPLGQVVQAGGLVDQLRNLHGDGSSDLTTTLTVEWPISPSEPRSFEVSIRILSRGQAERHLLVLLTDQTERRRSEEAIRRLAYYDALTGLPNRTLFYDRLSVAFAQAHRSGEQLAVLVLDLNRFKLINDTLGHAMGAGCFERSPAG